MQTRMTDFARLTLLIERLLDADVVSEGEGTALLTETDAARQSLEAGDGEAVRAHVEQIARFTEALVRTEALALADGRAVIETAHRILAGDGD